MSNNEQIASEYKSGKSLLKLCREYKLSDKELRWILRYTGTEIRNQEYKRYALTPEQERNIIDEYHSGIRIESLSKKMKISKTVLYGIIHKNAEKLRYGSHTKVICSSEFTEVAEKANQEYDRRMDRYMKAGPVETWNTFITGRY